MDEQIKQIGERVRGLRDALDLSIEEMAADCQLDLKQYQQIESGESDISVSTLQRIAHRFDIPRKGTGISVERTKAYKYESLASGFRNRKADPFIVTVEPKPDDTPMYYNTHSGQEFNLVIEGRLLLSINGKELVLNPGDSLYFNSSLPHGMKALDGKTVKFLAIVMQ